MLKQFKSLPLSNCSPLLLPALFIYIAVVIIMPKFGHDYDIYCWGKWAVQLKSQGFVSAYDSTSEINYLPVFLYILKGFSMLFEVDRIMPNIYLLKAITWVFDTATILLVCSLVKNESNRMRYMLFGLLNVGFFYNTIIWNQVDGILTFFIFASFYLGWHKKITASILFFVLGLNFKLQGIIFAPILLLFWLPGLTLRKTLYYTFAAVLLQVIIVFPFLINGNLKNVVKVAFGSVDYFQFISMNAFNFWHLILTGNLRYMPDNEVFIMGMTHKTVGLILFCSAMCAICVPLYWRLLKAWQKKMDADFGLKLMLVAMALCGYVFYYFNTQMHERYIHPVMIFLTALAFLYRHWVLWLLVTINYAISLEYICRYFELNNYETLVFNPRFMAVNFTIGLVMLSVIWYKTLKRDALQKEIEFT